MEKANILIVEDDPNLGNILREYLSLKGYEAHLEQDGEAGLRAFGQIACDLLLLDLMMPKKDGFTVAEEIRAKGHQVPIIFLTAKSMQEDVLRGFKIGGDDYITKPFSMEELLLRIMAVLKRVKPKHNSADFPTELNVGQIKYYYHQNKLIRPGGEIKLTTKENELLRIFFENLNQTVKRTDALLRVWRDDSYFNARSMDVYIAKLRKYLKDEPNLQLVTIHGEGFKLVKVA